MAAGQRGVAARRAEKPVRRRVCGQRDGAAKREGGAAHGRPQHLARVEDQEPQLHQSAQRCEPLASGLRCIIRRDYTAIRAVPCMDSRPFPVIGVWLCTHTCMISLRGRCLQSQSLCSLPIISGDSKRSIRRCRHACGMEVGAGDEPAAVC